MKKIILSLLAFTIYTCCTLHAQKTNQQQTQKNMQVQEKQSYVHPHGVPAKGKILMVASSPAVSKQTGWPIGFWAAELTHPMRVFQEAGYDIELVSTEGGKLEMDSYSNPTDASGYSAGDIISLGYMQKPEFNKS